MGRIAIVMTFLPATVLVLAGMTVTLESPRNVRQFDSAEFVFQVTRPRFENPFTGAAVSGEFRTPGGSPLHVTGFCDSADGGVYRLRFAPPQSGVEYGYKLRFRSGAFEKIFQGVLRSQAAGLPGPVEVDPAHPKHFRFAGSKESFYHLGYTAYHLLDPSRTDAQVDATIDYCARMSFNKIRFLLAGYPRDTARRGSSDPEHGVPDPAKVSNYGAPPGRVNPLPVWEGAPHRYDFTRFHLPYWRRVERAIARMRARGIVATCIVTIEKQDLPREYGLLTEDEFRLYRYAVARLAAFDNVWWDLGNEHNEYRDTAWGDAMGHFLKALDPHQRLRSAHAYADFPYAKSGWANFIVTQQYGDEKQVHDWVLRHAAAPMPYVNEEYGYEGDSDKPGQSQNRDMVRRAHWAIAMAGGYATYGDWSKGVSYFYMGDTGPGVAAQQLRHLRVFFEALPFRDMQSRDELIEGGFCLAASTDVFVFHLPRGGAARIDLGSAKGPALAARWFDPRSGAWQPGPILRAGLNKIAAPTQQDWVLLVR